MIACLLAIGNAWIQRVEGVALLTILLTASSRKRGARPRPARTFRDPGRLTSHPPGRNVAYGVYGVAGSRATIRVGCFHQ